MSTFAFRGRKIYVRAGHVHAVHVLAVLASLEEENRQIRVLGQATGHDGPGGAATGKVSVISFLCHFIATRPIHTQR